MQFIRRKKVDKTEIKSSPIYPAVPELDWLKHASEADEITHSDDCSLGLGGACDCPMSDFSDKMTYVYKYLLWNRRMHLTAPQTDKFLIAFGFVLKYQRLLYGIELTARDQKTVAISEEQYKKLRRGEKL